MCGVEWGGGGLQVIDACCENEIFGCIKNWLARTNNSLCNYSLLIDIQSITYLWLGWRATCFFSDMIWHCFPKTVGVKTPCSSKMHFTREPSRYMFCYSFQSLYFSKFLLFVFYLNSNAIFIIAQICQQQTILINCKQSNISQSGQHFSPADQQLVYRST